MQHAVQATQRALTALLAFAGLLPPVLQACVR